MAKLPLLLFLSIVVLAAAIGYIALVYGTIPAYVASALPQFEVSAITGNLRTESTSVALGYPVYICAAAANRSFAASDPISWASDSSSNYAFGGLGSSIGRQSSQTCTVNLGGVNGVIGVNGTAMTEIGINGQQLHSLYNSPTSLSGGIDEVIYSVSTSGSFVVIVASVGGGG